jgi:hypothetical protein
MEDRDHGYRLIHKDVIDALRAENECLRAENDAVWDALSGLADYLTPDQIHAELRRRKIDMAKAVERVRAALEARHNKPPADVRPWTH